MCDFCRNQRPALNARTEARVSWILTDLKERAGGPKATARFVEHAAPVDLRKSLNGLQTAVRSLDRTMEERQAPVTATNCERNGTMSTKREYATPSRYAPDGKKIAGVEVLEVAVTPKAARQYQPILPPWNEPRLSAERRQAVEAEAAGLRAQLQTDLTPGMRIRVQQALTQLERILGKTGSGDAVPESSRSM
jgi:hypothetical protein